MSFPEAARLFPPENREVTGLPVRAEFFAIPPKRAKPKLTILITGGSQGSRTLNRGRARKLELFSGSEISGALHPPDRDRGACRAGAKVRGKRNGGRGDAVYRRHAGGVCARRPGDLPRGHGRRGGTGGRRQAVDPGSAAAPRPISISLRNAEAFQKAGAAVLVLDREMDGGRLFEEVAKLRAHPELLQRMGERARAFAHPDAAGGPPTCWKQAISH